MSTPGSVPRKVLLAAAADGFLASLVPLLRAEGYETDEVRSGYQALAKILAGQVDVALLEENLSDESPLEVVRAARRWRIPILLCSSSWNVNRAVEAMKEGAWDYLPCPCPSKDVLRALAYACQQAAVPPIHSALAERQRQAQKMELFGRLACGVIHDFNNLLTVVLGYCDLLKAHVPQGHALRLYVNEITRVVDSGSALTHQLLAFSRTQVVEPVLLDVNTVLARMELLLARLLGDRIRVTISLAPHLGLVRADAGQLEQVVMNLAVNARDAMPHGGQLTLTTANLDMPYRAEGEAPSPERGAPPVRRGSPDPAAGTTAGLPVAGQDSGDLRSRVSAGSETHAEEGTAFALHSPPPSLTPTLSLSQAPTLSLAHAPPLRAPLSAPPGAYVVLQVTDSGTGMDAATRAHLFEPYFTTKDPGKGTGLGLATVQHIIESFAGHIDVASAPGQGATFAIYLPRTREGVPGPVPPPTPHWQSAST